MSVPTPESLPPEPQMPETRRMPEEYAVNAFDMAVRGLEGCQCETKPCKHIDAYNSARHRLLDEIRALHNRTTANADV